MILDFDVEGLMSLYEFASTVSTSKLLLNIDGENYEPTFNRRFRVFKKDNCTCQVCGLVADRGFFVLNAEKARAQAKLFCGNVELTVDHIKARVNGGRWHNINNLQALCEKCNRDKGRTDLLIKRELAWLENNKLCYQSG